MEQPPVYPSFLYFDYNEFSEKIRSSRFPTHREWSQMFVDHINQELLRRPRDLPLDLFGVKFAYTNTRYISSRVDSWVRFAASAKTKVLCLNFSDGYFPGYFGPEDPEEDGFVDSHYKFQFSELVGSKVEMLILYCFDIDQPCAELPQRLDSIKEMHLSWFHGSGEQIEHFLASCVNLETLSLEEGLDLERFRIVSPKIRFLMFGSDEAEVSVEVCAPSLELMGFRVGTGGLFVITGKSSLVRAKVEFGSRSWRCFTCWSNVLRFLSGVERLTIQNMWTWFMCKEKEPQGDSHAKDEMHKETIGEIKLGEAVFSETFAFPNLKRLRLLTGYLRDDLVSLEIVLKKCPQLETLILVYSYPSHIDEQLGNEVTDRPIALHLPHLRQVRMKHYRGTRNELYVVGLLKKHGQMLEQIVAFPRKINGISGSAVVL